tara:strand:- start:93 stop:401 length:309 start_codon:yes stop_codon:yes gene_type:complete
MENAFTMYNKNYYACKKCDGTVHVSLPCPDCNDQYEVVTLCEDCEGQGTIQVDPLNDHWDYDCHYCDGTGEITETVDLYSNIKEVADDYGNEVLITLKREKN